MMALREVLAALSPTASTVALKEAVYDGDYQDPDRDLSATQGGSAYFRRLTQGPADLNPLTQERMQQLALHLYDRNPLAKRILELIRDHVVGEGFTATSKDEDAQEVIDRFWFDAQNNIPARMHAIALELGIWGEQAFAVFVNEQSGHVRIVSIDPRSIKSVIPDANNPDLPAAILLNPTTVGAEDRALKIIRENDDGLLMGAEPGETLKIGERTVPYYETPDQGSGTRLVGCFFWAINKVQAAMRGRSDLLCIADFVDLYDRLLFDDAERMSMLRAFVWDVEVKNANATDLQKRAATEPMPKPGSVKFHNEAETWKAVSPALGSQESATTADLILSIIATGAGVPKTWLNGIMDVNRASAGAMDDPSLKHMAARQDLVGVILQRMVRFALDQAEVAAVLPKAPDGRHPFTISAPEMSSRDLEKAARSLFSTIQALGMADAANWIDDSTSRQALVLMLGQLGINLTVSELEERLEAQKEADAENDNYEIPGYFGVGGKPGKDLITKAITPESGGDDGESQGAPPPVLGLADPKGAADVFAKMMGAIAEGMSVGVMDQQLGMEIIVSMLAGLGVSADLGELQQRMADAKAEEEAAAAEHQPDLMGDDGEEALPPDFSDLELPEVLAEAFDEAKHVRIGGRFAPKPDATEGEIANTDKLNALYDELKKVAAENAATGKAVKAKKGKAAPKPKKEKPPKSLTKGDLSTALKTAKDGDEIEATFTTPEGTTASIKGTVTMSYGGIAVVAYTSADGTPKKAVLHSGLKNVTGMKVGGVDAGKAAQNANRLSA